MFDRRTFLAVASAWTTGAAAATAETAWPLLAGRPQPAGPSRYVGRHGRSPWRIECLGDVLLGGSVALYRYQAGQEIPLLAFTDAVPPRAHEIPGTFIVGRTARIERRPSWCPTPSMRAGQPGVRCYGPGEAGNPMGQVAKFHIQGFGYRRLHSYTNSYWQTQGCFSIHDAQMQYLLGQLSRGAGSVSQAVRQGVDVLFAVT